MQLVNQPFLLTGTHPDHACLLLHGLGGGVYEHQLLGEHLHQQGLTAQAMLYPGHDCPAPRMPRSTWEQWYECILQSYEQLSQSYSKVSLIGFSTGCPLALHLAATYPVHKLVLLAPYVRIRSFKYYLWPAETYLSSIGQFIEDIPRFRLPIRDPAMQRAAKKAVFFRSFNLPAVRSAMELIEQVKLELPSITAPTLIIQSPKDTVIDPAGAEWVYQALGSTTKDLYWLTESDHTVSLDVERQDVFAKVGAFLAD
jgi:carboxylesterase